MYFGGKPLDVHGGDFPDRAAFWLAGWTIARFLDGSKVLSRCFGLQLHRRQDAGQNEDTLSVRERQQIETLSRNSQKIRSALADFKPRLNRKGEELKSNLTDPDSAVMKTSHGVVQGYTGVAAVDAKAQVVVLASAFGTGQENSLLPGVVTALRDDFAAMGQSDPLGTATVLTDSGYHSEATLQQLADAGVDALVADTGFRSRERRAGSQWPSPSSRLSSPARPECHSRCAKHWKAACSHRPQTAPCQSNPARRRPAAHRETPS